MSQQRTMMDDLIHFHCWNSQFPSIDAISKGNILVKMNWESLRRLFLFVLFLVKYFSTGSAPGSPTPQRLIQTAGVATQVYIDKKAEFTLKPKFLEVVRSLPNTDPKQTVFSYEEVIHCRRGPTPGLMFSLPGHVAALNLHSRSQREILRL